MSSGIWVRGLYDADLFHLLRLIGEDPGPITGEDQHAKDANLA